MPQLNKKAAKEAENAASGFDPIAEGTYHFVLKDVDGSREGAKGPYWSWEYECVEDEPQQVVVNAETGETKDVSIKGRRVWNNTSLSQAWSLKQTFDAFGVGTDTDTDELLGQPVKLVLSVRTIQEGTRAGQLSNNVDRVLPADDDIKAKVDKARADAAEMADLF